MDAPDLVEGQSCCPGIERNSIRAAVLTEEDGTQISDDVLSPQLSEIILIEISGVVEMPRKITVRRTHGSHQKRRL